MYFGENVTYWGEKLTWRQRAELSEPEKEAMGINENGPEEWEARELIREANAIYER